MIQVDSPHADLRGGNGLKSAAVAPVDLVLVTRPITGRGKVEREGLERQRRVRTGNRGGDGCRRGAEFKYSSATGGTGRCRPEQVPVCINRQAREREGAIVSVKSQNRADRRSLHVDLEDRSARAVADFRGSVQVPIGAQREGR